MSQEPRTWQDWSLPVGYGVTVLVWTEVPGDLVLVSMGGNMGRLRS